MVKVFLFALIRIVGTILLFIGLGYAFVFLLAVAMCGGSAAAGAGAALIGVAILLLFIKVLKDMITYFYKQNSKNLDPTINNIRKSNISFIKKSIKNGIPEEEIRKTFMNGNWDDEYIEKIFKESRI